MLGAYDCFIIWHAYVRVAWVLTLSLLASLTVECCLWRVANRACRHQPACVHWPLGDFILPLKLSFRLGFRPKSKLDFKSG